MWATNSGAGLGHYSTAYYGSAAEVPAKYLFIYQDSIRSNMISLWIKNSLTTDVKRKLKDFKTSYTYNNKYDGSAIFFVIVKVVYPE